MQEVHEIQESKQGTIIVRGLNDYGREDRFAFLETRCGVCPPIEGHPYFYYLVLGVLKETAPSGKNRVTFMAEGKERLKSKFYQALTDDLAKLRCRIVYTQERPGTDWYSAMFKVLKPFRIKLTRAPFADDAPYGGSLVEEYLTDRILSLPLVTKPQVKLCLNNIPDDVTKDAPPPFHALRFVLGGLEKHPFRMKATAGLSRENKWEGYV